MGSVMFGRQKYIQQSHWCLSAFEVEMVIEKLKRQITWF